MRVSHSVPPSKLIDDLMKDRSVAEATIRITSKAGTKCIIDLRGSYHAYIPLGCCGKGYARSSTWVQHNDCHMPQVACVGYSSQTGTLFLLDADLRIIDQISDIKSVIVESTTKATTPT